MNPVSAARAGSAPADTVSPFRSPAGSRRPPAFRTAGLFALAVALGSSGCVSLPPLPPDRTVTQALEDGSDTRLGRTFASDIAAHPGLSGLHPLPVGEDAYVARLALVQAADRTLDLQYYIWHSDTTGKLLIEALLRAADRGVRVRILIDDMGTAAKDANLLAIDSHPNVEVRLFNPIALRKQRGLGIMLEAKRVNRRMHNKSITADGQATIIGGRNIGDEYFAARDDVNFGDLDVLAVGPVVKQVSTSFDLYWNGAHAYPITVLAQDASLTPERRTAERANLVQELESKRGAAYAQALKATGLTKALVEKQTLKLHWGKATAIYDNPDKVTTAAKDSKSGVTAGLKETVDQAREEILIVSPYFVPGKEGVAKFAEWRQRGLRVVVLTNSLAATDVGAVHAGYAHYREDLLKLGVELYELKPNRTPKADDDQAKEQSSGGMGSSRASLHAKTFYFDRRHLFIGSLNLDPRSIVLNTEIGILAECEPMARGLAEGLDRIIRDNTYRLERDGGNLRWVTRENGVETIYKGEPQVSGWRRFGIFLYSLLPIEGQL